MITLMISLAFASVMQAEAPAAPPVLKAEPFDLADVKLQDSPFKSAMDQNARYLLLLEPDRFLHYFQIQAGLPAKAPPYTGWESDDQGAGRCLGHYLSALSLQYRASADSQYKQRVDYIVSELAHIQAVNGNGYLGAERDGKHFWDALSAGDGEALKKHRVPWYIQHKLFAGLRDAYLVAGDKEAETVLLKLSDWAIDVTAKLDDAGFQKMLEQEHGGMREVLCDVYAITGDRKYLVLANRFYHAKVIEPLVQGRDLLAGLHANTQIPKLIGEARYFALTGEEDHYKASLYFWQQVVHFRTYANGGNSDGEHFNAPSQLANHLGPNTSETCNTYNMLKLTQQLFEFEPRVEYADYMERALFNHILASIGPEPGNYTYYVPMKSGRFRCYSDPYHSFWCCVGTGMENHTKYGQSIYYHQGDTLWVNQFISSELHWDKVQLRMETDYPHSGTITLTFGDSAPQARIINLRYPAWAAGISVELNDQPMQVAEAPGSYITIKRVWKRGDQLHIKLPLALRSEPLLGNAKSFAVYYGPLLLCGQLDPVNTDDQLLRDNPSYSGKDPVFPTLTHTDEPLDQWLKPVPGQSLEFRTHDVGLNSDLDLIPFYLQNHHRYIVYWNRL